jgi:hypothetical protein
MKLNLNIAFKIGFAINHCYAIHVFLLAAPARVAIFATYTCIYFLAR